MTNHSSVPSAATPANPDAFRLFWTVGFCGKRFFGTPGNENAPGLEEKTRRAITSALDFFVAAAGNENARLTAISSLARGGDVLFVEACLKHDGKDGPLPWKCVLPFERETFFKHDLETDSDGQPLSGEARSARRARADACLASTAFEIAAPGPLCEVPERETAEMVAAYMECGYGIVDEADVMICLLKQEEFEAACQEADAGGEKLAASKAGTLAAARYAIAGRRPCLLLNVDAEDPWATKVLRNDRTAHEGLFHDPLVTPLVRRCEAELPPRLKPDWGEMPVGPVTKSREKVLVLQKRLGALANDNQGRVVCGLKRMLSLHLAATGIAAVAATVFAFDRNYHPAGLLAIAVLLLALMKPLLAFWAQRIEESLHHHQERESWLHARILAELCRGALSLWPMPQQPMGAADEEDFPKLKRLLRSLRLLRALDQEAAYRAAKPTAAPNPARPWEGETANEANMREAVQFYTDSRLNGQIAYFEKKQKEAVASERRWHGIYLVSIWTAIGLGGLVAALKICEKAHFFELGHGSDSFADPYNWLAVPVILAPFLATYALGMITINDCRRRASRYAEMVHHLQRLSQTLSAAQANRSRLKLVEQAERTLIEEQHEWFSVTRNYSV